MLCSLVATVVLAQAGSAASDRFAGVPEQDVLLYDITLDVDFVHRRLQGRVLYRIRTVEPVHRIRFDARPPAADWQLTFADDAGRPLPTTWNGERVDIGLGREIPAGDHVDIAATFAGSPPGGFSFVENRYGELLAFTDHYSIRAHGWLPCVDHPGDRATFRLDLTYPAGLAAAASGVPLPANGDGAPASGRAALHHETTSDIPPYMFAVVVGPFAELAEAGDARLRPHLVYRQDVDAAKRSLVHHAAWLRTLEQTFGSYAYGSYRVVQCPTRWGGFEAPGNVLLSERLFDADDGGVGTLAHELTHMWFGDAVGYAQWHDVWLSEGFASYFGPWLHEQVGGPTLAASMTRLRDHWRASREARTRTIRWDGFSHPDLALNANTYPKGAWVLHMLRGELGDEAFFAAIRDYYRAFAGRSVTTSDFVASVETSTGKELGWFFEQWLDRKNCPELKVASAGNAVVVEQVQRGDPYRFRLRLGWQDAAGEAAERVVDVRERETRIEIGAHAAASLAIDPKVELLYR